MSIPNILRDQQVQHALASNQNEISQFKRHTEELRNRLETLLIERDTAQATHASYTGEIQQLRAIAGKLREELESARINKENALQQQKIRADEEIGQLHETIQAMRVELERLKAG